MIEDRTAREANKRARKAKPGHVNVFGELHSQSTTSIHVSSDTPPPHSLKTPSKPRRALMACMSSLSRRWMSRIFHDKCKEGPTKKARRKQSCMHIHSTFLASTSFLSTSHVQCPTCGRLTRIQSTDQTVSRGDHSQQLPSPPWPLQRGTHSTSKTHPAAFKAALSISP